MMNEIKDYKYMVNDESPYDSATCSTIVAFLVYKDMLHRVIGEFIHADRDSYDHLKAEELFLDHMTLETQNRLIELYTYRHDIEEAYNDWYYMYYLNRDK